MSILFINESEEAIFLMSCTLGFEEGSPLIIREHINFESLNSEQLFPYLSVNKGPVPLGEAMFK